VNPDTYYRDHWAHIDDTRLDTYEAMFEWQPRMAPLLEGADIQTGCSIIDYGCGPGGLAIELARRAGPDGMVHGLDLNTDMVERARARAEREGFGSRMRFDALNDDVLPVESGSVDVVVCKSVLEYVADPAHCLREFSRVTRSGGRVHIIDSDWGMMVVEPLDDGSFSELFSAASMAYHTPHIGRRLYGLARAAGLKDIQVKVLCAADTTGIRAPVVRHMISYARESGSIDGQRLNQLESQVEASIEAGTYMMLLPQFVVTGTAP
jgi:ubiquinone/menaquinone biosynthesis C-methylase UbiE